MTTATATVALGLTRSDYRTGYLPSMDGWIATAKQDEVSFEVVVPAATTAENIASAAFEATNSPFLPVGLAAALRDAWEAAGHDRTAEPFRSLSVGDTVAVFWADRSEVLEVARSGFRRLF